MSQSWTTIAVVLVALVASVSRGSNRGTATLVNKADEPISRATVTMSWGETYELANLDPVEQATVNYRVREGDVRLDVVFRSGKRLETEGTYVASGFDFQDQITVTSSEIQVNYTAPNRRIA